MTIQGRIPGRYHVHPSFAVKGAGSLIGPGQWITVQKNSAGFANPITLYNGKTVNLENFGLAWPVNGFSILTFLVGLVWLLYWIVPKPTVSRLAVTSQLSVNDDGGDAVGLITRKDHRAMNYIVLAAALLLIGGWIYEARAFPVKIPLQVDRFAIQGAAQPLTMSVQVANQGGTPAQVKDLHMANLRFANPAVSQGGDGQVTVEPAGQIAPRQTQTLTMTIRGGLLEQQRLIPVGAGQSNTYMTMVLDLQNGNGVDDFLTVSQFLTPT